MDQRLAGNTTPVNTCATGMRLFYQQYFFAGRRGYSCSGKGSGASAEGDNIVFICHGILQSYHYSSDANKYLHEILSKNKEEFHGTEYATERSSPEDTLPPPMA